MTTDTRTKRIFTKQFKEETVALVTEQGYSIQEAADAVGVRTHQIYNWKLNRLGFIGDSIT